MKIRNVVIQSAVYHSGQTKKKLNCSLLYFHTHVADNLASPYVPAKTSPPARCGGDAPERLIVAVKAENANISKSGLAWALTHAAKPGDYITLLAVFSGNKTGNSILWNNFALTFCLPQSIQK